jgi:iron complex outermembrane recepter protein
VGAWKGWGGFIQFQWKDAYYIDNANFLKAPEYELVNLNFYYNVDLVASTYFKSAIIYFFGGPQRVQLNLPGFRQQQFQQPQSGDRAENPGACWRSPAPDRFYAGEPRPFMGDARFAFR